MEKIVVIIGAGKIGRGFVAHLFSRSGYRIALVDASAELVDLLRREKKYRVDIARDRSDSTEYIDIENAFTLDDRDQVAHVLDQTDIIVTSVGASNIDSVANYLKHLLMVTNRTRILNWIICENATQPAKRIKQILLENAGQSFQEFVHSKLGLVESQVLRTGMPGNVDVLNQEPLALRMQDWWTLPLDRDAFIGNIPNVEGFRPTSNFANELVRKLYTFNGTNGPIAYIGWANGYKILHEAALAFPEFFAEIQEESAFGIIHEFNIDEHEQRVFMALAMKKYTDATLQDQIERNAKDTKRKLGRDERLVGPAALCLKHGKLPHAYAKAIAAAYCYEGSTDAGTLEVRQAVNQLGIGRAVERVSGIAESSPLYELVLESYYSKSFIFQ